MKIKENINNSKQIKSLFEIESFLKRITYLKNSYGFIKTGKYLTKRKNLPPKF